MLARPIRFVSLRHCIIWSRRRCAKMLSLNMRLPKLARLPSTFCKRRWLSSGAIGQIQSDSCYGDFFNNNVLLDLALHILKVMKVTLEVDDAPDFVRQVEQMAHGVISRHVPET